MRNFALSLLGILIATSVNAQTTLVFSGVQAPVVAISEEVLRKAYQRIGIQIRIIKQPGKRALRSSNSGKTDGEVMRSKGINEEYSNLIMVPVPVNFVDIVVFTKNVEFTVNSPQSLKPYKIGIRRGVKISERLTKGLNTLVVDRQEQLLSILDRGRVDVILMSRLGGVAQIKELKLRGIKILEPPLATGSRYHYLHSKHENLVTKITESLKKMEEGGEIKKIRNQYISKQYQSYAPL
ncbi:MAG: hypothetical protein OFPI_10470 [Osedax symbiont Rs2]|nr:MAG: hypothetical protein OFPI_10470 [Osedax symbiont Rs2]